MKKPAKKRAPGEVHPFVAKAALAVDEADDRAMKEVDAASPRQQSADGLNPGVPNHLYCDICKLECESEATFRVYRVGRCSFVNIGFPHAPPFYFLSHRRFKLYSSLYN